MNFAREGIDGELEEEQVSFDIPGLEEDSEVEVPPRADDIVGDDFGDKHAKEEDVAHEGIRLRRVLYREEVPAGQVRPLNHRRKTPTKRDTT